MSIRRFRLDDIDSHGFPIWKDCENGGLVKYTDHAAEVERLTAERDALKEELEHERVRLAGCGVAAMGYEDKEPLAPGDYGYSASYGDVLRFRRQVIAERDASVARAERLAEALMPSAETKAAYIGKFIVKYPELDEEGNDIMRALNIPWVVIKEIMAAIKGRAEAAIAAAPDKPQYAALSPEPWGGPEVEE